MLSSLYDRLYIVSSHEKIYTRSTLKRKEKKMDIFTNILFGHLFGDYMLQGKKMAIVKGEPNTKGTIWCFIHSTIYTACICLFVWRFEWYVMAAVFATHYPIDRWSLGGKWLKFIRGRDFMTAYENNEKYWEIDLAFSTLVYAVVDNTMHLVLLWALFNFVF